MPEVQERESIRKNPMSISRVGCVQRERERGSEICFLAWSKINQAFLLYILNFVFSLCSFVILGFLFLFAQISQ